MTAVIVLAKIIKCYADYVKGRRRETNLALLRHLEDELARTSRNIDRSLTNIDGRTDVESVKWLITVRDEVDGLKQQIGTMPVGPFQRRAIEQSIISEKTIRQLMEVDAETYQHLKLLEAMTEEIDLSSATGPWTMAPEDYSQLISILDETRRDLSNRTRIMGDISIGKENR